ncbi:MAG: hypothetical protein M1840_007503 [Geoglossum simile]|nr:MAG: hypothetical protein M1840_007503 [Geoglossum simile]
MDDWGSPWADDTGTSQLSSPPAAAPVEPSNQNLDSQSAGGVLTSLERGSPWADDEGLGEWASVESSAAPAVDEFPDWSAEASTGLHLPLDGKEKGRVAVQDEVKPFWRNGAGLSLSTVETDPDSKPRISHSALATESMPPIGRASVEAELGPQVDGGIKVPPRGGERVGPLVPTALLADWKNDCSNGVDYHTGPPLKSSIEGGNSPPRPVSSLTNEKRTDVGTMGSPRTSIEEVALSQRATGDGEDDFGEFEETKYEVRESEVDMHIMRSPVALEHSEEGQAALATSTPQISPDTLAFEIDMSLLDLMIPQSHSEDFPPDMEDDIISSTSRTWYRISRKETLREHNGGSGDYVRATWVGSAVQANAIKIVARWINEDRTNGGGILGGGNRLGAMFGWGEGAQRMSGKPRETKQDLHPSSLGSKATSLETMPRPFSPVAPQQPRSSAINSPIEDPTNSNTVCEANTPAPQFCWSSFTEGGKRPALDTPQATASTHQRAISMIPMSPISSLSPPGVMSYPSLRSRPASIDFSGRRVSESLQIRGSNPHSGMLGPRKTGSAQATIQLASPASQGNSPIRKSSQGVVKVEFHASEERRNPWPSADLSVFDGRTLTEVSPFMPLYLREFGALGVRKPSKEATEDEVVEVDRAIERLPNLTYMLR